MSEFNVQDIIRNHIVFQSETSISLEVELEKSEYSKFKQAIARFGGRWDRKSGLHVFDFNPKPAINLFLESGKLPEKNPSAFFPTPKPVVDQAMNMVETRHMIEGETPLRVLEPSAGFGALAKVMREQLPDSSVIQTVELMEVNQAVLRNEGFDPYCGSFLDFHVEEQDRFDLCIMNPPFSVKGDPKAFITHVNHAFNMLKDDGQLIAILPTGWISGNQKIESEFKDLLGLHMQDGIEIIPQGAFKESGTNIETCIISLSKSDFKMQPCGDYDTLAEHLFDVAISNDSEFYSKISSAIELNATSFPEAEIDRACKEFIAKSAIKDHQFFPSFVVRSYLAEMEREWESMHSPSMQQDLAFRFFS